MARIDRTPPAARVVDGDAAATIETSPLVLVADGDAAGRDLYGLVLRTQGVRTISAADGWEALVCARTLLPDLVVTDGRLPGLDAPALVERLRADPRTAAIPVIAVVGPPPGASGPPLAPPAVVAALGKPLRPGALRAAVLHALRRPE